MFGIGRFFVFLVTLFLATVLLAQLVPKVLASDLSSGVAVYIQLIDKDVEVGQIVSLNSRGYSLSTAPYDPNIFGVIVKNPAIAFEDGKDDSYPVVSQGKVYLKVSGINGPISRGDLLTTSRIRGVAQKATESGYVVASALEDYKPKSTSEQGLILVVLNVGHGNTTDNPTSNLIKTFDFVMSAPYASPIALIRYLFAGVMVVLSFVVAVGHFGRVSGLGIEALGRNPLAGRMIIFGIVTNIVFAISIVLAGIAIGYLILVI